VLPGRGGGIADPDQNVREQTEGERLMPHADYILEARNLTRKFGEIAAVQDLSIGFPRGQLHSILGPNGAGKTTLFNLLTRDYPVTSGEIYLKGERITRLQPHQIAQRGVGRSYQISSVYLGL